MIYDKIREICGKKGISIRSLEKEAGLSYGSICKWNKSSPTVDKLQAVSKVLKVKVDKLID